jgi:hypothetical protein
MSLRTILFWPLYRIADWVDNNPVSAVGIAVAVGSLSVLFGPAALGMGAGSESLALNAGTAALLVEIALERPAYPAVAGIGLAVALIYNG